MVERGELGYVATPRYTLDETRYYSNGDIQAGGNFWIDAETPDDAIAIYRERHGDPISTTDPDPDEREIGDYLLRMIFDVDNGNNPYTLQVDVYDYSEVR